MANKTTKFKKELQELLNRYSVENSSNTPDFILADYLMSCLNVFNATMYQRERWYGRGVMSPATFSFVKEKGDKKCGV